MSGNKGNILWGLHWPPFKHVFNTKHYYLCSKLSILIPHLTWQLCLHESRFAEQYGHRKNKHSESTCCCCCSPSETYGRKAGDSNFQLLVELPVPPQAAGIVRTLNCCAFSLYNSDILSTTVSFIFTMSPFYCVHFHYFASALCMNVMCLTSLTDSFDDRRPQFCF